MFCNIFQLFLSVLIKLALIMESVDQVMTDANDDDYKWIGKETLASETSRNVQIKLSRVSLRLKAKNNFWQKK